jgi:hypothetical protein
MRKEERHVAGERKRMDGWINGLMDGSGGRRKRFEQKGTEIAKAAHGCPEAFGEGDRKGEEASPVPAIKAD